MYAVLAKSADAPSSSSSLIWLINRTARYCASTSKSISRHACYRSISLSIGLAVDRLLAITLCLSCGRLLAKTSRRHCKLVEHTTAKYLQTCIHTYICIHIHIHVHCYLLGARAWSHASVAKAKAAAAMEFGSLSHSLSLSLSVGQILDTQLMRVAAAVLVVAIIAAIGYL